MSEIINFDKIREGQKKAQDEQAQKKAVINEFIEGIKNLQPSDGAFDELASFIMLPDEQFDILKPVMLTEIERAYNNVNDQVLMAQIFQSQNVKLEDVKNEYLAVCKQIDETMMDVLSHTKRDFFKAMLAIVYNAAEKTEGVSKRTILIPIEKISADAKTPTYAHITDSGMDVYAIDDIDLAPGETKLIPLGIKVAIPEGYELQVRPKSGRSIKSKLRIANTPGTIDAGYRDEIKVIAENNDQFIRNAQINADGSLTNIEFGSSIHIGKGEKFAQLVLAEVPKAAFYDVQSVSTVGEDRGGGFGSTGNR